MIQVLASAPHSAQIEYWCPATTARVPLLAGLVLVAIGTVLFAASRSAVVRTAGGVLVVIGAAFQIVAEVSRHRHSIVEDPEPQLGHRIGNGSR